MQDALQELLESIRIREVLADYCIWLDEANIEAVRACFAGDATADYGPGRGGLIVGAQAIADRIAAGQSAFRRTHHQIGQIRLSLRGSEASTLTYVTAWHERLTGEQEIICLRYVDRLRAAQGRWVIANRRVEVSFVDGFPGTPWYWVKRGDPAAG
jgi:hypothetical protein